MKKLYEKLLTIQKQRNVFEKNGKANYGKYVTLDSLLDKLLPICSEQGILVFHTMEGPNVITRVTDGEEEIYSSFPVVATDPQKIGSAITYAKRYNLGQIFNIVTDEDKDGKTSLSKEKKVFDNKKLEGLQKRSLGKSKGEVMQYILKIQKEYELSDEMKSSLDLFLNSLK